ncbi:MAG: hypothetical protein SGBAC_009977 [Bacillariaceae sp.]
MVMFTDDHEAQAQYIKELLGVATILFSIWLFWSCFLLMCRGTNCISEEWCCPLPTLLSSAATTVSSVNDAFSDEDNKEKDDDESGASEESSSDSQMDKNDDEPPTSCCHSCFKIINNHWHLILRTVFAIACMTSICSSVLVFGLTTFPTVSVFETTDHLMEETQLIVTTTQRAIKLSQEVSTAAIQIETKMKSELIGLCPGLPHFYLVHELGVDPYDFVLFLDRTNEEFSTLVQDSATRALDATVTAEMRLQDARDAIQLGQDWIWILSLLMLCLATLTLTFLLSMFWAIFQEQFDKWYYSGQQQQWENMMSWCIVPVFATITAVIWAAAISLSIGAIVITDVCLPTPDESVLFVLRNMDNPLMKNPRILDMASFYMTGCHDNDPLHILNAIEGSLNGVLGMIDSHLEDILTDGFGDLEMACGRDNKLDSFFASISQLSYYLHNAYEGVQETHEALDCANVSGLYHELFHGALCTEFASAASFGFVLVLTVATASLQILTFRAACNYVKAPRID